MVFNVYGAWLTIIALQDCRSICATLNVLTWCRRMFFLCRLLNLLWFLCRQSFDITDMYQQWNLKADGCQRCKRGSTAIALIVIVCCFLQPFWKPMHVAELNTPEEGKGEVVTQGGESELSNAREAGKKANKPLIFQMFQCFLTQILRFWWCQCYCWYFSDHWCQHRRWPFHITPFWRLACVLVFQR